MKDLTQIAIDTAVQRGASYADCRIVETQTEDITVRNGKIGALNHSEDLGFGVRVIASGAWGFACSSRVNREEVAHVSAQAVQIALASARLKSEDVRLAPEGRHHDCWQTPFLIDPFRVSLETKLDLLLSIDKILRKNPKIKAAEANLSFKREHQWLATSEGTFIDQLLLRSGAGYTATAVEGDDVQVRSFPNSFRGQFMTMGYELVLGLPLLENAERVREEALALLKAKPCPSGQKDLILDGSQLALQIHESVGHPTELDRVMGMEANYAGTSFLNTDKLKNFQYGSEIINLVCDSTVPNGLATRGYDDDGVPSQRWHLVEDGRFVGYQFNRELAHLIDASRSSGNSRADGWENIPIIRNTNLSLMPGEWELEDLIADTKEGIYLETNRSWSIDQQRLNFQFSTEIGWEIKNGKKGTILKNPTYQGITPQFWRSCDAICNSNYWTLWGVHNCGKGQPSQRAEMSHGAAPARFRNVTVGVRS
ncbi:TldD/PmbA family protein [candidate division KSB1 bacterium]|nr:TldD/PmbA family protein [candidate division KSB1 bacterium]